MYFAWRFGVILTLCAAIMMPRAAAADKTVATVAQVISIVRAGLPSKQDDKTAKALTKLILAERLDPVVLDHMESEGAGPRTMEELALMADVTAELAPPTPPPAFPHPPVPFRAEMAAAIHQARVYALSYETSCRTSSATKTSCGMT